MSLPSQTTRWSSKVTTTSPVARSSTVSGPGTLQINAGGFVDLRDAVIDSPVANAGHVLARTSAPVLNGVFVNEAGGHLEVRCRTARIHAHVALPSSLLLDSRKRAAGASIRR